MANRKSKKGSGMGVGGWMGIITGVMGFATPFLKKKSSNDYGPESYAPNTLIQNLELDKKFYSMNQATKKSELEALKLEREMLRNNDLSSPSLKAFEINQFDDIVYADVFNEMKSAYIFGEALDDKQDVIEIVMSSQNQDLASL